MAIHEYPQTNKQRIIIKIQSFVLQMQFHHIKKHSSSLDKQLKQTHDGLLASKQEGSSVDRENIEEILSNIDQINFFRSYQNDCIGSHQNTMASSKGNGGSKAEEKKQLTPQGNFIQFQEGLRPAIQRKSLIYAQSDAKGHTLHESMLGKQIKVYYFNLPTYKIFNYDEKTTIKDVIVEAIIAYINDKQLDSSKVQDKSYKDYEMRLLLDENRHEADMTVPSISYDRLIIDNLIDELVLVEKRQGDRKRSNAENHYGFAKSPFGKDQIINIVLLSQKGDKLAQLRMKNQDSIEEVYRYIEEHGWHQMKSFYLTENLSEDYILPKDFMVINLQSNKIYLKLKRFIDEANIQPLASTPIRKQIWQQSTNNLPISLKEASQYQEFTVIKVNKLGFEQERIIGIDQDKIYNYSKEIKEEKKQTSIFRKLFGVNETTGTKRPFRLIQDITRLQKTEKGFNLTFSDKVIKYYIHNPIQKERAIRKLNFLISHSNEVRLGLKSQQKK